MNFGPIEYTVARIDGDYAYLQQNDEPQQELKCVARALLPAEITEGTGIHYEMMEYTISTP
ncbi:chorismate--pyruvate lyase [Lachnospiraceae bacterium]|nr:chorismate--pyruvate lyase [Lachnospiraceae bacterium]